MEDKERFVVADKYCYFCGRRSSSDYLFIGKKLNKGWYINEQGWISNGSIQVCEKCLKGESYQEILEDIKFQIDDIKKRAFGLTRSE